MREHFVPEEAMMMESDVYWLSGIGFFFLFFPAGLESLRVWCIKKEKPIMGAFIYCLWSVILAIGCTFCSVYAFVTLKWPWYFLGFVFIPLIGIYILLGRDGARKFYHLLAKKRAVQ